MTDSFRSQKPMRRSSKSNNDVNKVAVKVVEADLAVVVQAAEVIN